jgi:hypothetical protein
MNPEIALADDNRDLDAAHLAVAKAAWRAGHLTRDAAADSAVNVLWRAASAWGLAPAIYSAPIDNNGHAIVLDFTVLRARLTPEGAQAIHALLAAVTPPGPRSRAEEITSDRCVGIVRTDRVKHACRRVRQLTRECRRDCLKPARADRA